MNDSSMKWLALAIVVSVLPSLGLSASTVRLISPRDGAKLAKRQARPVLTWTRPLPVPSGPVSYSFRLVEVKRGQTKEQAMQTNPAWFEQAGVMATRLSYPEGAKALEDGRTYAWQVAIDGRDEEARSEVWSLTIGEGSTGVLKDRKGDLPCLTVESADPTANWGMQNIANLTAATPGPDGPADTYLRAEDDPEDSYIYNEEDFGGDWTELHLGTCLCWDFRLFDDGRNSLLGLNPSIVIYSGFPHSPNLAARFRASGVTAYDGSGPQSADTWVHVCAPIALCSDELLPFNSLGQWEMTVPSGAGCASWEMLLSNVAGIKFGLEVANVGPREVFGFDNICLYEAPPADAGPDQFICCDDPSKVIIGTSGSDDLDYAWSSDPPGFTSTKPTNAVEPSRSTRYYLEVTDPNTGCSFVDSVDVYVLEPFDLTVSKFCSTSPCPDSGVILIPSVEFDTTVCDVKDTPEWMQRKHDLLSYAWSNGENTPQIEVDPVVTTTYELIVSDPACYAETVEVVVSACHDFTGPFPDLIYPNAFTPNADGQNDEFVILEYGPDAPAVDEKPAYNAIAYKLVIWTRWGAGYEFVGTTSRYTGPPGCECGGFYNGEIRWNGRFNRQVTGCTGLFSRTTFEPGDLFPVGVYNWTLSLMNCTHGEWVEVDQGSVTLLL